ncbi:peptigoglycan-binding protein LysM [Sulfitobacter sp. SK012]|uniref:LysM peptidoglycan-binding domain-containing protein n=1 Tax=Sulfitobacter sp. SK012 TaxID=1389005 RepID=UPI000E0CB5BE|nr:LysM peptidoglycan-binding domain-containing protein [Sulfitobacter sp. SK012]AXI47287.1 peptigoglycan-binding protein LysM [Sulfitobacter sp. SK012]
MDQKNQVLSGNGGAIASAVLLVAVLAGGIWYTVRPTPELAAVAVAPMAAAEPEVNTGAEAEITDQPAEQAVVEDTQADPEEPQIAAEQGAVDPASPSFDELRREPDGTSVIAGRAEPGSTVTVLVDGEEVTSTQADASGSFAALATVPPDDSPHVITLSAEIAGQATASVEEMIVAPLTVPDAQTPPEGAPEVQTQPVAVAVAEPEASVEQVEAEAEAVAEPKPEPKLAAETPVAEAEIEVADAVQSPEPVDVSDAVSETPAPVAILKSDADGVTLAQGSAPDVMKNVALDTIGYGDAGEVQLSGRAQSEATQVRVYLDNNAIIDLAVGADGRWRGALPDVDEGIYTLRVDEVTAEGEVSSRVETPFKRESAAVLAQATAGEDGPIKAITVQKGATLWAIARDRYGDGTLYVRVFEANATAIRDPDLIYPGQVFDLPN